jgi:tRNA threonylcarbamoyladenosine biosynthesis protein TsaE
LKAEEELEGIGFDEYLDSGHFCFIEWPELAEAQLPPDAQCA